MLLHRGMLRVLSHHGAKGSPGVSGFFEDGREGRASGRNPMGGCGSGEEDGVRFRGGGGVKGWIVVVRG